MENRNDSLYTGPSITAEKLKTALVQEGILEESSIVKLLGADRSSMTLRSLEVALVRNNILNNADLARMKGRLSGLEVVTDTGMGTRPIISSQVSLATGAVVLDRAPLTVALVEDLPSHVERLYAELNQRFEVWLCTMAQFAEMHKSCYSSVELKSRPDTKDIFEVLDEAVTRRASDILLSVGLPPTIRVDGRLVQMNRQPLDSRWMEEELPKISSPEAVKIALEEYNYDLAYSYGNSRFRLNLGADRNGLTLSARSLPTKIPTPDDLGLPRSIRSFVNLDRGLVLVTGPTGSGKSTTLAALLNYIALNQSRHIITLEDPIEFHLSQGKSVVNQRELGESFTSFAGGLRQALRQDPDVILVGEMRDLDTMRTAVTAAETGHLVFGTLHTFDAASSVARIVSSFPDGEQAQARQQLSYILKGIVSQTLLPSATGVGRLAAFEIMTSTSAVTANLRKIDGHNSLKQTMESGVRDGMQTMDMALASLVRRNLVTMDAAREKARSVENLENYLRRPDEPLS